YINLSINQRHIRNFKLSQAIINAYHTLQAKDKYPLVFLNITMDPKLLDVNVHPSKVEVKLSKEKELLELVEQTVRNTLVDINLIPEVQHKTKDKVKVEQDTLDLTSSRKDAIREAASLYQQTKSTSFFKKDSPIENKSTTEQNFKSPFKEENKQIKNVVRDQESKLETETVKKEKLPYLEIIGQLHGTYIIMQNETGMYLMDQHAAQERIKYEYYYNHVNQGNEGIPLFIPYIFEFSFDDVITIDEKLTDLRELGFEIEKSGVKEYTVSRYPSWIKSSDPEQDIGDVIDFISQKSHFDINKYREEMSIMMSCKRSIKANHYLDKKQMEALLESLGQCQSPYTCPHGRPVIIHMTTYEIERLFNRIMK